MMKKLLYLLFICALMVQWYFTAHDGENSLSFAVDTRWPEGV